MSATRVLGVDPGIATMGYGLVQERSDGEIEVVAYGAVTTAADEDLSARLQQVYRGVRQIVEQYRPASVAVEKLLFGKNVTTAVAVGQARGVILLAVADCGLTVAEYTPAIVKQSVTGYGNASKSQVQDMIRLLLHLDEIPRPDDAADALAVAVTHLHSMRYHRLERMAE